MNITKEMIEYCKNISCEDIMADYNLESNGYNFYNCVLHNDNRPSMRYTKKMNLMRCFSCGETLDSIGLYAAINNMDCKNDFLEVIEKMWFEFDFDLLEKPKIIIKEEKKEEEKKEEYIKNKLEDVKNYLKNTSKIEEIRETINEKTNKKRGHYNYLDIYLNKRKIDYDKIKSILEFNKIEIRHKAYKINKDKMKLTEHEKEMINKNYTYINSIFINIDSQYLLQRTIDDYILKDITKNDKYNHGLTDITIIKGSNDYNKILIVEGIYDGLSFLSNSENPEKFYIICLNSIENFNKFILKFDIDFFNNKIIYSGLDNDKAGNECNNKLKEYLKNINIERIIYEGFKDLNEYYINKNK